MRYNGFPKLTPTKLERLITHCPECDAALHIRDGKVDACKDCAERERQATVAGKAAGAVK